MATVPNNRRLSPRTATPNQSIWRVTSEDEFRRSVVGLARASKGVAWTTDAVTRTTRPIASQTIVPRWERTHQSEHSLPLAVERRLSDDFAYIAAVQDGVHGVTAACTEEHILDGTTGTDTTLTLRLAANGGIPDDVRSALEDIWQTVQKGAGLAGEKSRAIRSTIYEKIVRLNDVRILQRIRSALGAPPSFPLLAMETANGSDMWADDRWAPEDAAQSSDNELIERLQTVSKQAFQLTTTGQDGPGILFNHVLEEAGLDVERWFNNKPLAQVYKISAYWPVAKTLKALYRDVLHAFATTKVQLEIITLAPYRPIQSTISTKVTPRKPRVDCYVHAEIQLLCHYLLAQSTTGRRPPRVIGTSKLACFLCFLCISCYGIFEPPLPHGQIYDQWTVPDLAQFDGATVKRLRQTIALMGKTINCLSKQPHASRPFPLTSREHVDVVPVSSVEASSSNSLCRLEMSDSSSAAIMGHATSSAVSAVPDLVPDNSSASSRSELSGTRTTSSWPNGQSVTVSTAAHRWTLPHAPGLEISVEAEPLCTGQARLACLEGLEGQPEATASIVVDELRPGEDCRLSRAIDQPHFVIDFRLTGLSGLHRLHLKWEGPRVPNGSGT